MNDKPHALQKNHREIFDQVFAEVEAKAEKGVTNPH